MGIHWAGSKNPVSYIKQVAEISIHVQSDCFKIIPPTTTEEKLASPRKGMKYAAAHGITSIQNASGTVQEFLLYETL